MKPRDDAKPAGAGLALDAATMDALARKVVAHLQQGTGLLTPRVAHRLHDIRELALRTLRQPAAKP
jgi:hypothetical protein